MTAAFWDKRASKYDELVSKHGDDFEQTLAWARPLLAGNDIVLDFGCGTGEYALELAGCIERVHGIDTSQRMIDLARQKCAERNVSNASFDAVDVFDATLDDVGITTALALSVLHLVDDPAATLSRIHGLLGPGGRLISETPCLGDWKPLTRFIVKLAQKVGLVPKIAPFTIASLESTVASAGFRIDESKTAITKSVTQWIVATAQ